jgi:hypothetical protein
MYAGAYELPGVIISRSMQVGICRHYSYSEYIIFIDITIAATFGIFALST